MDPKNSSSDDLGTDKVSDDMLLYLVNHYLKEQDCLALALSGSSHRFPSLYASNRKQLAIGRCFFLTPASWTRFFSKYISPQLIITFDASHAYWLPAEVLIQSTVQMTNLEELSVDDTKVSLSHFPKIFEACQSLVKLSFTMNEKSLNEEQLEKTSLDLLKCGFAKLTYLKIFNFTTDEEATSRYETMDVEHPFESWLRILQVLKWCRDCTDLVIHLAYPRPMSPRNDEVEEENQQMMESIQAELFPLLGWMKNLQSLAILRNGDTPSPNKGIIFVKRLLGWLLPQLQSLTRLWVTEDYDNVSNITNSPFVKSIKKLNSPNLPDDVLKGDQFANLEHFGGNFNLDRFGLHPHLKYAVGHCKRNDKALNDFCRSHPNLEQIHFQADDIGTFGDGDLGLNLLKIFVYRCVGQPSKKIIQQVIKGCPNIEELHLDLNSDAPLPIDFFSEFRFKHLRRLSIKCISILPDATLSNGSYLPWMFKECQKLESLQLNVSVEKSFFEQLTLCLPAAANLRDLRLEWQFKKDSDFLSLLQFMEALLNSSNLLYFERLVLNFRMRDFKRNSIVTADFVEFLIPFAKGMTNLVALGIFGIPIDRSAAEVIKRRLTEEVVPHREAFWFHLGDQPKENDRSVPRIHYDEVVAPNNAFSAPPKF